MTEKELKKLNRAELLQMLIIQTERVEALECELEKKEADYQKQLKELKDALADKKLKIEKVGSIAEASLALNRVFETAQQAADQYLENIKELYDQLEKKSLEENHEKEN